MPMLAPAITGSDLTIDKGMKYLNGTCYLMELSRYIVLNPVRAGMVRSAKGWKWSSYRSTAGLIKQEQESWLTTDWLPSLFSKRRKQAQLNYRELVKQG